MLQRFLNYLGPRPTFHMLWTYCGVWMLCGASIGAIHHFVFARLLGWTSYASAFVTAVCGVLIVAILLRKLGFAWKEAAIIALGGLCIALPNWFTFHLGFPLWQRVTLTLGGILISLPPFTRGMIEYRKRNPDY